MNLLQEFKNYLFSQEVKPSKVTVKNYLSDINNFIRWFEQSFQKPFSPTEVTKHVIDNYKLESSEKFSASSTERHLSSLRKFFSFLLAQKITSIDPFKPLVQVEANDPWHIKDFKNNLYVFNASHLTIKNYLIDIKQFLNWAEQVTGADKAIDSSSNILNHINSDLVEEYKQRLIAQGIFSPSTINRKLSSLRKYVLWLQTEGLLGKGDLVSSNIEDKIQAQINLPEPQEKEAKAEVTPFVYSSFPPYRLLQKLTKGISLAIDATLITQLVNLIEAAQHLSWKTKGQPIFSQAKKIRIPALFTHEDLLGVKNIKKEIYAPLEISTKGFPWYKKTLFTLKYQRPNWYKTYHSYAIVHYFHFAVLVIFVAGLAFGFYNGFVSQGSKNPTIAANVPTNPPRILSFQGRLTDNNDNPVTTGTNLRFAIYNSPTASGGALLWQEVDLVNPDTDGIFNAILGNVTAIPQSLFSENNALWLGVTVGVTPELTPRQQLATVAFAANSETLQGLLPITATSAGTTNVVLALNSSGNLVIGGSATPTFQASGGQFTISGQAVLITTNPGSNTNIKIEPDGLGKIEFNKPILNNTLNNNISTARGSVEIDDLFSILATSTGQSAFTLNQNSTGPLISASASGNQRFTVDNAGNVFAAGDITVNGNDIQDSAATSRINFSTNNITFGSTSTIANGSGALTLNAQSTSLSLQQDGAVDVNIAGGSAGTGCTIANTSGNLTCSGAIVSNGVALLQNYWAQNLGALFPTNSTLDVLVGGQSTTSAKFRITGASNRAGTDSVASVAGNTSFAAFVVDNVGSGDLIAASSSAFGTNPQRTQFRVTGTGAVYTRAFYDLDNPNYYLDPAAAGLSLNTAGSASISSSLTFANGAASIQSSQNSGLTIGGSTTGEITLSALNGQQRIRFAGYTTANCDLKADTNGFVTCGTDSTGTAVNWWNQLAGVLSPVDTGYDFALGGNSTSSARFSYTGIKSGQGIASISGQLIVMPFNGYGGNASLSGQLVIGAFNNGIVQTTNNRSLTLGGNTTGNIIFAPNNSAFMTLSPNLITFIKEQNQTIKTANSTTLGSDGGNLSLITGNGADGNTDSTGGAGGDIVLTAGNGGAGGETSGDGGAGGDIFLTAGGGGGPSAGGFSGANGEIRLSGTTNINTTTGDNLTIGSNTLSAFFQSNYRNFNVSVGGIASAASHLIFGAFGNSSIQTVRNQPITIGGNTSGNVIFSPLSGAVGSNVIPSTNQQVDLGVSTNQWRNIYGQTIFSNGVPLASYWNQNLGALFPNNSTVDLLIGSTATSSADFAITGIARPDSQVRATLSGELVVMANNGFGGSATLSGKLTLGAFSDPTIQTTRNQGLTIGGNTTGQIIFSPNGTQTLVMSPNRLSLTGASTVDSTGALSLNTVSNQTITTGTGLFTTGGVVQINGTSGTAINISNTGIATDLSLQEGETIDNNVNNTINLGFGAAGGILNLTSTTNSVINASARLDLQQDGAVDVNIAGGSGGTGCTIANTSGNLTCSGAIVSNGVALLQNYWAQNLGALFPTNSTLDFLFGSQATVSSRFRLVANNLGAGTLTVASISGRTSFATLVVNNDGVGDLITASASGWTRFKIANSGAITSSAYTTGGGIIYATSNGLFSQTTAGNNNECLKSTGGGTPTWGTCGSGGGGNSPFQELLGAIVPNNSTEDLLIGGQATNSAIFALINVNSGTPTLKVWDSTSHNNSLNLSVTATAANITAATGIINIGQGGGTLYVQTDIQNDSSNNLGAIRINDRVNILASDNVNTNAALIVNNAGSGDIFSASAGGTQRFTLTNAGGIRLGTNEGNANNCLLSGGVGVAASWNTCPFTATDTFWNQTLGALYPNNSTVDLLIGGSSTASADFAITGIARPDNQVRATLSGELVVMANNGFGGSATLSGKLTLGAFSDPTIQTTRNQTLVIGGDTTGHVLINDTVDLGSTTTGLRVDTDGGLIDIDDAAIVVTDGLTVSGAIGANGGITFDQATDTVGAFTMAGNIIGGSFIITDIGSTGTDFDTSGGLTITTDAAGTALTVDNAGNASSIFVAEDNNTPVFTIADGGNITLTGTITDSDSSVDVTDTLNANDITTDTGGVSIAASQSYTGAGAVTLSSGGGLGLTLNSASNTLTIDSSDTVLTASGIATVTLGTSATINAGATALNLQADGTPDVNLAGGSGATGCTIDNGTGNLVCSGAISSSATTGVQGWWNVQNGSLFPTNSTLDLLIGGSATTSAKFRVTGASGRAGTDSVASISGTTSFASLVTNNDGVGDLFTASKSGLPIFTVRNNGQLTLGAPYYTAGCTALETNSAGTLVCGTDDTGSGGVNWWNQLAGALSPVDTTNDFLLGSTATSSALFSYTGIKTGQTIASVSGQLIVMANNGYGGNASLSGQLVLGAFSNPVIQTTKNQGLTIGGNTTGNITLSPLNGGAGSLLTVNALTTTFTGTTTLNATSLTTINAGALTTIDAAASVTLDSTLLTLGGGAAATVATTTNGLTLDSGSNTLTLASSDNTITATGLATITSSTALNLNPNTGTTLTFGSSVATTLDLFNTTVNTINFGGAVGAGGIDFTGGSGSTGCSLDGSNGNFSCSGTISSGGIPLTNYWAQSLGSLFPANSTVDLLIGGNSTTSAKFRVTGASNRAGTDSVASISGLTSFAAMVVDNQGVGDLFTASASGLNRFVITNQGAVGVGLRTPLARVDIKDTSSRAIQGSEKITNSNDNGFDTDTGNWTTSGTPPWKIDINNSNDAVKDAPGTGALTLSNSALNSAPVAGEIYRIELDYSTTASSSGSISVSFGGGSYTFGTYANDADYIAGAIVTATNTNALTFTPSSGWYGSIKDVFVYPITTNSIALRIESDNGTATPIEFRAGGSNSSNIFIGDDAGYVNTNGSSNNAFGKLALSKNIEGSNNNAFGVAALANNTTGSQNTGVGDFALNANNFGNSNTGVGYQALRSNVFGHENTASGIDALFSNYNGDQNSAVGSDSLYNNTIGSFNSSLGYRSLFTNITGSNNSALGRNADVGVGHLYNASAIGAFARVDQSSSLILGAINGINSATESARIGIGTTAPYVTFDVRGGSGTLAVASFSGTTSFATLVTNNNGVGDLFTASKSGASIFTVRNNGQLTLGAPYYTAGCTALETNAAGTVICGTDDTSAGGVNYWATNLGALFPINSTLDLLIGGQSTASAKFAITGLSNPNNQVNATLSGQLVVMANNGWGGNATISGALTLGAFSNPTIQTTKNQSLTIGGNTTGNINLMPLNGGSNGGKVGIGTISPLRDLHVLGNANTNVLIDSGGTSSFLDMGAHSLNTGIAYLDATNNDFQIGVNSYANRGNGVGGSGYVTRLRIEGGTGNVSIGRNFSTPHALLHVEGGNTGGNSAFIVNQIGASTNDIFSASTSGTTHFRIANNGGAYGRNFNDLDNILYFLDPAATGNSLITAGNIGVANTSPRAALDVVGNASFSGNLAFRGTTNFQALNGSQFIFQTSPGGDAELATKMTIFPDGTISFGNLTGLSGGGVSISTSRSIEVTSDLAPWIYRTTTGWTDTPHIGDLILQGRSNANAGIGFITGTTPNVAMFIESDQSVGIGSTVPFGKLLVEGSTDKPLVTFNKIGGISNTIFQASRSGEQVLSLVSSAAPGNTALTIMGYDFNGGSNNGSEAFLSLYTTGGSGNGILDIWVSGASDGDAHFDHGRDMYFSSQYGSSEYPTFYITDGEVGINTDTPAAALHIKANGTSSPNANRAGIEITTIFQQPLFSTNSASARTLMNNAAPAGSAGVSLWAPMSPSKYLLGSYDPSSGSFVGISHPTNYSTRIGALFSNWSSTSAPSAGSTYIDFDEGEQKIRFFTSSTTEEMVLSGGWVGIGTTAPGAKLDIEGNDLQLVNIGTGASDAANIRFQVTASQPSTAAAQIWNAYPMRGNAACTSSQCHTGLSIKLGTNTSAANPGSSDRFINFARGNGFIVGKIFGNGTNAALSSTGGDYAEYFRKANVNDQFEQGDVVCSNSNGDVVKCDANNTKLLGVVSNSFIVLGNDSHEGDPNYVIVGLLGQLKTKISSENGPVNPGDLITYSSTPGYAAKAVKAGGIIGRTLEGVSGGKANAYISQTWYDPDVYITSTGGLNISVNQGIYEVRNNGNLINRIGVFASNVVGNLQAGGITAKNITTDAISIVGENLNINGLNIRDYIAGIVSDIINNTNGNTISPIASVDQVHTNLITPVSPTSDIALKLEEDNISILNGNSSSSATVTSFDNKGNATLSGSLAVGRDATVGGTLRASRIIADQIEGLNIQAATVSANYITNNYYNSSSSSFPTLLATPSNISSASSNLFSGLFASNNFINIATYSSELAYVENLNGANAAFSQSLTVFGSTLLSDTSIVGQLSVNGSLILANNSINVLGSDLNLQPLRQGGLSVMAGLFYIDTNGNVTTEGDATVKGTLYANAISPIPGQDLAINLGTSSALTNPSLKINNASGAAILAVNQKGDLVSSGSGTFGKINIGGLIAPALAVSPTEVIATGSAGTGTINTGRTQMTINNKLVTEDSLIYITPTSSTTQTIFLLRQEPGESFTVGIQNPTLTPIKFNWIIVN